MLPTLSLLSVSYFVQVAAFATGVPPNIYEFHLYTGNSATLSGTQARQYRAHFQVEPRAFTRDLTSRLHSALRPIIPNNACTLCITAAAGTELAGASLGATVSLIGTITYLFPVFLATVLYDPKTFITHAASLRQAFAHCARFPTAASRRSLDRVSVPVWLAVLSDQLPVLALVGRYPAN